MTKGDIGAYAKCKNPDKPVKTPYSDKKLCYNLIYSVISNDSVSGQRWS